MAGAGECLGADKLFSSQIDLRLVPEFDPVLRQGLVKIDAPGDRGRMAELEVLQQFKDRVGLKRLSQYRQHLQPLLFADAVDVGEHGRAATRYELHPPAIVCVAERDDAGDRFGEFERDVEKDHIGRAARQGLAQSLTVGKFLGIDAGAVQNERQEVTDAAIAVDDEAQGRRTARACFNG